ncbi:MAG: hypothetical protein QXR53_02935 [Candidatus Norongarragalinales archaeon]
MLDWRVVLVFGAVIIMCGAISMAYYFVMTSTTPFSATPLSGSLAPQPQAERGPSKAIGYVTLTVT